MKKTEKMISAFLTIALGILIIALRGDLIKILMAAVGIGLIAFGFLDLINKQITPAVIKLVIGTIVIICGLIIVEVVLYVVAALLLIAGILLLYEKIKKRVCGESLLQTLYEYAVPALFIVIGILLLFNQGNTMEWVFIVSGVVTVIEGGVLLVGAFMQD